ncbi:Sulfotransferase domain-containing protein [Mariprofundus aestuarium]|uniref:Sulfotransferase domain-containing protein n=1 Tax=Mariprofundus aestuarium TaxID=1921086 RepID=A0A2K8L1G5_MARES|nr:sulfotransferase domain-containing protein [Mariprofundus aestuarium]ATX79661.1 Sulfotransferase domain-containing protein [Mariprofundus aestuarium]
MSIVSNMLMLRRRLRKELQYAAMRHVFPITDTERVIASHSNRIFANSIPKAGTNLLSRLLKLMPNVVPWWTYHIDETIPGYSHQLSSGRKGQVITAHLPWSPSLLQELEHLEFRKLLIVRDMRDVAVSGAYYVTHMDRSHPLHDYLNSLPNDDERLMAMIKGVAAEHYPGGQIPPMWENDSYKSFLPWVDDPDNLLVRFEDLIGAMGGGDDNLQEKTIRKIASHIGTDLDAEQFEHIRSSLFSTSSRTFRKGQVGEWRNHFNEAHKQAFKDMSGYMLIRMGYEKNNDW